MAKPVQMKFTLPATSSDEARANGPASLGTRLPAQDYEKLRRTHFSKNKLFEDPYFPANNSSLFFSKELPFKPEWKRPKDICANPKMVVGGVDQFDVSQGVLGDCWLVAAIASLTQDKILFNKVVMTDQVGFGKGYAGIFHFRFWHFGEWVDVVIDDYLPTHNGRLIFIHSKDENEFWSALLEKAYAKLYGGYESLKGGKTSEAMTDFTGGVVEAFDLKKEGDELFKRMLKSSNHASLMSCSIKPDGRDDVEAKLDSGLIKGHAYSVLKAATTKVGGKEVRLVAVRNPWGQKEWNGDWSDNSKTWNLLSADERNRLLDTQADDGQFWMSYDDLCKHFTDFEICSVTIDELYEDEKVKSWNSIIINGGWHAEDSTAGGCRNYPTFVKNPQYVVELKEDADGDGKCSVLIALMQKHRRKQKKMGVQDLCIGYSIYKSPDDVTKELNKEFVDYNYSTGTSGSFTNSREVMKRFDLDPGRYFIIPCAFKPGEEGDFLLRIFTETVATQSKAGADRAPVEAAGAGTGGGAGGGASKGPKRELFDRLAGEDGEIDAEELQDILTASFSKDMNKAVFSVDACRSMIAMLDEDKNGTLNYEEFQALLVTIGVWKRMFFKFDRDRSGTLEKDEVSAAIRSLGYELSPRALTVVFNRFAKHRKFMKLDDFAACLSRVKIMEDTFKKMAANRDTITLVKDQFFQITFDA